MYTDDHRGRHSGLGEQSAPGRDPLTVSGEDDGIGRVCWNVYRDPPFTLVCERLSDKLSWYRDAVLGELFVGMSWLAVDMIARSLLHGLAVLGTVVALTTFSPQSFPD